MPWRLAHGILCLVLFWGQPVLVSQSDVLKITLLIVPETIACKPKGYTNYGKASPGNGKACQPISDKDIYKWKNDGKPHVETSIVPGDNRLHLGDEIEPALEAIADLGSAILDPSKRYTIVFVFDWGEPVIAPVELQRMGGEFPSWSDSHHLRNNKIWITHHRADALVPTQRVRWKLNVANSMEYNFRTD